MCLTVTKKLIEDAVLNSQFWLQTYACSCLLVALAVWSKHKLRPHLKS